MPAAEAGPAALFSGTSPLNELPRLFAPFVRHKAVLLAVSGGPDSTALMLLAKRWRDGLTAGPALVIATVDHGLRPESRAEAEAVGTLAASLGLPHAVLSWDGSTTRTGLQEAARHARYDLLAAHAHAIGATAIATAHTCDDQAETVLFRLMRGSGPSGLAGIPAERPLDELTLIRPLLDIRKADLVATCHAAGIAFVEDPSNRNPRFARVRMRALMPALEAEGLDAPRLSRLATRMARAEAALEVQLDAAMRALGCDIREGEGFVGLDRAAFLALPEEIGLRLMGRAVAAAGHEGPAELGKLEALCDWLRTFVAEGESPPSPTRSGARTLAGALIRVSSRRISVRPAPPRRSSLPVC